MSIITKLGLNDSLSALGISGDTCNSSAIADKLQEATEQLGQDTQEAINLIASKLGGNFVITIGALLEDFGGASWGALKNSLFSNLLHGDFLSSWAGATSLLLTFVPSTEIVLLYWAAQTLETQLRIRDEFAKALLTELDIILEFVKALQGLNAGATTPDFFANIAKSLRHIQIAERIVGIERGKQLNKNAEQVNINIDNIKVARLELQNAIDDLTSEQYSAILREVEDLHNEYGLEKPLLTNPDAAIATGEWLNNWISYFNSLSSSVKDKFFDENGKPSDDFKEFSAKLLRLFPEVLRTLSLYTVVSNSTNILVEKFPIVLSLSSWSRKRLRKLLHPLRSSEWKDFIASDITRTASSVFSDPATNKTTWKQLMVLGQGAEAAILAFPSYWDFIQDSSNLGKTLLDPALRQLRDVESDMIATKKAASLHSSTHGQVKFKWVSQISSVDAGLAVLTGENSFFERKWGINPFTIQYDFEQAGIALESLKTYINNKHENTEPGDVAFEIAQKYLGPLSFDVLGLIHNSTQTIAGVQAARVALSEQQVLDRQEAELCNIFTRTVESIEGFSAIQQYLETVIQSLESDLLNNGVIAKLRDGNLSDLAEILDTGALITEGVKLANCLINKDGVVSTKFLENWAGFLGISMSDEEIAKFKGIEKYKNMVFKQLIDTKDMLYAALKIHTEEVNEVS